MHTEASPVLTLSSEQAGTYHRLHLERMELERALDVRPESHPRLVAADRIAIAGMAAAFLAVVLTGAGLFGVFSFGMATFCLVAVALVAGLHTKWSDDWSVRWVRSERAKDQARLEEIREELLGWHGEISEITRSRGLGDLASGARQVYEVARLRGGNRELLGDLRTSKDGQNEEYLITDDGSVRGVEIVGRSDGTADLVLT